MKQNTKYHECKLNREPWDILPKFIEGGLFVQWRRMFKRISMISRNHPFTPAYASSLYALKEAEKRHLMKNYHMIHPFSMFSFYFDMVVMIYIILYYIRGPIMYPLLQGSSAQTIKDFMIPVRFVYLLIIIVNLQTGYYDELNATVIMDRWRVTKHYMQTYLFFDLLSFLPGLIGIVIGIEDMLTIMQYQIYTSFLTLSKFSRYFWCIKVMKCIRIYYGISTLKFSITLYIFNLMMFLAATNNVLLNLQPDVSLLSFLQRTESNLKMLLNVSHGPQMRKLSTQEKYLTSIFILFGFVFHLRLLISTMEIWLKYFGKSNQEMLVYNSMDAYMRHKALPINFRKRIYIYLEFKYQGNFYKESVIRRSISLSLKKEIILAETEKYSMNVGFLRILPKTVMNRIGSSFSLQIYLPGDYIMTAGTLGESMFVLVAGTAIVTSADDSQVVTHLRDGCHFGEIGFLFHTYRVVNIIAVTPCEILKLTRTKFWAIMSKYPNLFVDLQRQTTRQVRQSINVPTTKVSITMLTGQNERHISSV